MKQTIQRGFWVLLTLTMSAGAASMSPFVIPGEVSSDSKITMKWKSLTEQDRLSAGEHFVNQAGQRVRLWGVNLSFEANFPTHQDAERIAARMAAFGVNSVRCHHMDTAGWPRGLLDADGRRLHPEAMDRLDYFIDQLAKHGIYTDLNLHVGRKVSAQTELADSPTDYDKMVNIFTPELIEAQKDYARQLLTHKNPYRDNKTYAEDYAVAIVEITNENSLFMWGAENTLRTLPAYYENILQKQYNQWLKKNYQTQAGLEQKWLAESEPLGENLLKNAALNESDINSGAWNLEQHAGCRAEAKIETYGGRQGLKIQPLQNDGTDWHLQYNQRQLGVVKGKVYTVEFDAAAPTERKLNISVPQAHEPWKNLGLWQTVTVGPEWKRYRTSFTAAEDEANARWNVSFGEDGQPFYLANVSFRFGVEYSLDMGESLEQGTIKLFGEVESSQRKIDRMVFLAETEKAYFDGMKAFIQKELNSKALVTGTIVFGPLGLYAQSDMDFIDSHAYWQHPQFPNRPWDSGDWLIEQKAMSGNPPGTLYELAAERLRGKPFTVTEYNHPAPLDSQAECVPMIASFAAAQDWDGVWLYTYSHSNGNWDRQFMNSYFDIDTNPAKWGFMPAGALIFREGSMQPLGTLSTGISAFTGVEQSNLEELAGLHLKVDRNMLAAIGPVMQENSVRQGGRVSAKTQLQWDNVNNQGLYRALNDACCVMTGQTSRFSSIQEGCILQISSPEFAAVTVTALDGKPLDQSGRILITACGRCENTGMQFSEDRRTVGRNWGDAPVQIEAVEGRIVLPESPSPGNKKMTCSVLNPDGTLRRIVDCQNNTVFLKMEYGTMWYLIE
jgi:hypothetical protein